MDKGIAQLFEALRCLPGVGAKTAQRMAYHLLESRQSGNKLSQAIAYAMEHVKPCKQCRMYCETTLCQWCSNPKRDTSQLCVVEMPSDIHALEETGHYNGLYFVLMGHLSPLDGKGPQELGLDLFKQRIESGDIKEIILAVNTTVEGDATMYYIANLVKEFAIKITRIASGVPLDGELSLVSNRTLSHALSSRELLSL